MNVNGRLDFFFYKAKLKHIDQLRVLAVMLLCFVVSFFFFFVPSALFVIVGFTLQPSPSTSHLYSNMVQQPATTFYAGTIHHVLILNPLSTLS